MTSAIERIAQVVPDSLAPDVIELATGLSQRDIDMLKASGSDEVRGDIAVKFARQYDGLDLGESNKLAEDVLRLFAKDGSGLVRRRFAEAICDSRRLPHDVAMALARDELMVARPILEASSSLTDDDLMTLVQEMSEAYGLAIAGRQPLSEAITELLIEHRRTTRVVLRLIENEQAALSTSALESIFEWGTTNMAIHERLKKRPNLPFNMTQKFVTVLGKDLNWNALIKQIMSKDEATQILHQMSSKARPPLARGSRRLHDQTQKIKDLFDAGKLKPADIIRLLKDRNTQLMELSLAVSTKVDLRRIRYLLYGCDKRGLVALCLKAGFSTSEYLAFRMAIGLAEMGGAAERTVVTYDSAVSEFAQEQFENMRGKHAQIDAWIYGRHSGASAHLLRP